MTSVHDDAASRDASARSADAADVDVVVVSFHSADDLAHGLASVVAQHPRSVTIVDNAGGDPDLVPLADRFGARLVVAPGNVGYGAAVNLGAAAGVAPTLIVLNPDCEVRPGAFVALVAALDANPSYGAVGPLVRNSDGSVQASCRRFPSLGTAAVHGFLGLVWRDNPVSLRYTMRDWDHTQGRTVDWISGAAMAFRRRAFDAIGGFDPGYFMYVEDVDICWRLWQAGWEVAFEPAAEVIHDIGTSSGAQPYRLLAEHHKSMLRFERRRRGDRRGVTWPVVVGGVGARYLAAVAKRAVAGTNPGAAQPTRGTSVGESSARETPAR